MKAFIYSGGEILEKNIFERPGKDDLVIAADSGYKNARALGAKVDVLIGDFDSLGDASVPSGIERIELPPQKDDTDTQAAVKLAMERGCNEIIIIGGIGTRLDHSLSTAAILGEFKARGIHGYVTNGYNRIHYLENDSLLVARSGCKYLSVITLDKKCKGVSVEGCRYPLKNAKLDRNNQYAVSNEITGNVALVSVRRGALYVIESADEK